jgi:predicted amidohydrolase
MMTVDELNPDAAKASNAILAFATGLAMVLATVTIASLSTPNETQIMAPLPYLIGEPLVDVPLFDSSLQSCSTVIIDESGAVIGQSVTPC